MRDSLAYNQFPKWYSVTYAQAQSRANDGAPGIAITYDHIAIVRPNDGSIPTSVGKVRIAQAGATCYNDTTLSYGWRSPAMTKSDFTLGMRLACPLTNVFAQAQEIMRQRTQPHSSIPLNCKGEAC